MRLFTNKLGDKQLMIDKKHKDVLKMVSEGLSNKEIAIALNFSESYIKQIVSALLKAYKVRNRVELANEHKAEIKNCY